MRTISADEFKALFNNPGKFVTIKEIHLKERVKILGNEFNCEGVDIEGCIFDSYLEFRQANLKCGLNFQNCKFKTNLSITECTSPNYSSPFNLELTDKLIEERVIQDAITDVRDFSYKFYLTLKAFRKINVNDIMKRPGCNYYVEVSKIYGAEILRMAFITVLAS